MLGCAERNTAQHANVILPSVECDANRCRFAAARVPSAPFEGGVHGVAQGVSVGGRARGLGEAKAHETWPRRVEKDEPQAFQRYSQQVRTKAGMKKEAMERQVFSRGGKNHRAFSTERTPLAGGVEFRLR